MNARLESRLLSYSIEHATAKAYTPRITRSRRVNKSLRRWLRIGAFVGLAVLVWALV